MFKEGLESRPRLVHGEGGRQADTQTPCQSQPGSPGHLPPAALPCSQVSALSLAPLFSKSLAQETRWQKRQEQPQSLVALTDIPLGQS